MLGVKRGRAGVIKRLVPQSISGEKNMKLRARNALAIVVTAALVAQTTTPSSSIDLTPLVGLLTSILPLILVIMVIAMVFKMLGGMFEGLGSIFKFVKLRTRLARLAPLTLALLIAQTATSTTTTAVDLSGAVNLTTGIIYTLLPVIIVFVVLGFVLKLVGKIPEMIKL